jgi:hypothetical protein
VQNYVQVCLVSNARLCELAVQRSGDAAPQYVSTLRGQQLEDQQLFQLNVDLLVSKQLLVHSAPEHKRQCSGMHCQWCHK